MLDTMSILLANDEHIPPLRAGADVDHGVEIVVKVKHGNRTTPSGWMMRLVRISSLSAF